MSDAQVWYLLIAGTVWLMLATFGLYDLVDRIARLDYEDPAPIGTNVTPLKWSGYPGDAGEPHE